MSARIERWLADPAGEDVERALERLANTPDVQHIAVMPDVHLASTVCVGTVTATYQRILPEAVGGDIGCGMSALRFDLPASTLASAKQAAAVLAGLYRAIPVIKHSVAEAPALPPELATTQLHSSVLETFKRREAPLQLGTVGRGNHFVELQRDQEGWLWLMVHSGSRGIGPAIRDWHLKAAHSSAGLHWLDASSDAGTAYLADAAWARSYARANRATMIERVSELLHTLFDARSDPSSLIECDHNHVQRETHEGRELWVHRKGALDASAGRAGVIPGSMGSPSFHVIGRGEPRALCSSSHGAGRVYSRSEARKRIARKRLLADLEGIWFDHRLTDRLREEAPAAYKNISQVMRAQQQLTRITRKLEPILVFKGA